MGRTKTRIRLDKEALRKDLLTVMSEEQTQRLITYAKSKVMEIGEAIQQYHGGHNMNRTGQLLDSLCWGVSFQGHLKDFGFYQQSAHGESYLHEWFSGDVKYLIPVNGHELAESYIQSYGNNNARGWKVFFAILAPYWGYWEKGFTMKSNFGNSQGRFMQFAVMTQFYDEIRQELKPARVRFRTSVAKYNRQKLENKWNKYAGL